MKPRTIDDILREEEEARKKAPVAMNQPTVEPRRKHSLRRMAELFQAILAQEMRDEVPDRDWAEEFHDLWTNYYYEYWGDTDE